MRRSGPLPRRTGIARTSWAVDGVPGKQRRARMPRRGDPVKAAARRARDFGPWAAAYFAQEPCLVPGCTRGPSDPSHLKSRGAGGTRLDIGPMCRSHHREWDGINSGPETFLAKYGLTRADLRRAADLHARTRSAVALLPCGECGAPAPRDGGHRPVREDGGGYTARCTACAGGVS